MSIDIRPISEDEFADWRAAIAAGFGGEHRLEEVEHDRAIIELDRTLAAFDESQIVGTAGAFSYSLLVPGGEAPAAGVTAVTVLPTHRRRGILTSLMRRQLSDVRERGEPLAILWASESVIYGRFGYGMAAEGVELEIERARAQLRDDRRPAGRLRMVSKEEALKSWPAVYERARRGRPGTVQRSPEWWEHETLHDPEHRRHGHSSNRHVTYEEDGEALGYVRYRLKHEWPDGFPAGTVTVEELMAVTDDAYLALWRYVFGVDLMAKVVAYGRPPDEPLVWMLADPRRLKRKPSDSLWARLIDVPAALSARRYSVEGRLVLEVADDICTWAAGRYELSGGPEGAECRPSDREPDLVVGAGELAAAYLGRPVLGRLARAGRVAGAPEALHTADLMFSWDPEPWSAEVF